MVSRRKRINDQIDASRVILIGSDGERLGEFDIEEALEKAKEQFLDLVEVNQSGEERIPVCKYLDYSRLRYEEKKKDKGNKKKQKSICTKEIRMRPGIGISDYNVHVRNATKWLLEGKRVFIVINFRRRKVVYREYGIDLMNNILDDLKGKYVDIKPDFNAMSDKDFSIFVRTIYYN